MRSCGPSAPSTKIRLRDSAPRQRDTVIVNDAMRALDAAGARFGIDGVALCRPGFRYSVDDAALDAVEQAYADAERDLVNAWRGNNAEASDVPKGNDRDAIPLRHFTGDSRLDAYLSYSRIRLQPLARWPMSANLERRIAAALKADDVKSGDLATLAYRDRGWHRCC